MEKIDRKCRENIEKIKQLDAQGDETALILHLKIQAKLDEMRKELGGGLGSVVI